MFNLKSLNAKLVMLVFMGIIPIIIGMVIYVFPVFESSFMGEKKAQVKEAVDLTMGILAAYEKGIESKAITREKAVEEIRNLFLHLRYNETDYMFAYNKDGICVAHGMKLSLIGKDRSQAKDPNGKVYVQDFMKLVKNPEGGYVDYYFEKVPNGPPFPKISYVRYNEKFDWIVGSGVYIDTVQEQVKSIKIKVYSGLAIISIVSFIFSFYYARSLSNKLRMTAAHLNEEANRVSIIADSISNTSDSLSTSTNEQAAALQETSASIEETSAMIEKNAENAKNSMQLSERSQHDVEEGKRIISDMLNSIKQIAESNKEIVRQIDESNKDFNNVVSIIGEIENKTKVINDIVFQTKLLSFNASVEAARAGENGKGFAVVAEEVGKLAQISGDSAKEISEMLDKSTKTVNDTVENSKVRIQRLIQEGESKINQGSDIASRCSDIFDVIVANVNKVNGMMHEISSASSEQARGIKEINAAVIQLDSVGQQNSNMSQQTSTNSTELKEQVVALRNLIEDLNKLITG